MSRPGCHSKLRLDLHLNFQGINEIQVVCNQRIRKHRSSNVLAIIPCTKERSPREHPKDMGTSGMRCVCAYFSEDISFAVRRIWITASYWRNLCVYKKYMDIFRDPPGRKTTCLQEASLIRTSANTLYLNYESMALFRRYLVHGTIRCPQGHRCVRANIAKEDRRSQRTRSRWHSINTNAPLRRRQGIELSSAYAGKKEGKTEMAIAPRFQTWTA
jgi:hypothetical protein